MNRTSAEIETGKIANQQSSIANFALFSYMPPVYEGLLEAKITATGLPPKVYYEEKYYERAGHEGGQLVVENLSDQDSKYSGQQALPNYRQSANQSAQRQSV